MKILYVFTGGRRKRLELIKKGIEAPSEMFYGFNELKTQGLSVDLMETDDLELEKNSTYYKIYNKSLNFQKNFGIGSRAHYFINLLDDLNKFDIIIAIPDSIALGLAYWKYKGLLNSKIIYFAMGLVDRVYSKKYNIIFNLLKKKELNKIINQFYSICFLGKGEFSYMKKILPELQEKFLFLPFAVDTHFWRNNINNHKASENKYVLFVGNDQNRDFRFLKRLATSMPSIHFKFITKMIKKNEVSSNVELLHGDWRSSPIDDEEMRRYYINSSLVIIPLKKNSIQPSGQSVALQAISCSKNVLITKTKGFWDSDIIGKENEFGIIFVESNSIKKWHDLINEKYYKPSIINNNKINEYYSIKVFSQKLQSIILS